MTPIRYKVKDGTAYFSYKYSELKQWLYYGNTEGTSGMILYSRNGSFFTYKCYGTLEHPNKSRQTLTVIWHPMFNGKEPTNDEILIEPKPVFDKSNTSFHIFDIGEAKFEPLKKPLI